MKAKQIRTTLDAEYFCEGIINDFESGISNKKETMEAMADYTMAIHDLFWNRAKSLVKENPNYFEEMSKRNHRPLTIDELKVKEVTP